MAQQTEHVSMNRTGVQISPVAAGAGWGTLVALASDAGQDDLVTSFAQALDDERRHLALIHGWYHEAIGLMAVPGMLPPGGSAGLPPDATTAPTATPDVTTPPAGVDGMLGADI